MKSFIISSVIFYSIISWLLWDVSWIATVGQWAKSDRVGILVVYIIAISLKPWLTWISDMEKND